MKQFTYGHRSRYSQMPGILVARSSYSDQSDYVSIGDDVGTVVGGITGTVTGIVNAQAAAQANAAAAANLLAQQQAQTDMIMPIVIVGGLVLAFVLLKKKPKTNPSRRKRKRRNSAGLTKKGERMYRHIRDSYAGDPRAKEIAARTVYARAKRTSGLVRA